MKPKCPDCGSTMVKAGHKIVNRAGDKKQMYSCPKCRRRTINPEYK